MTIDPHDLAALRQRAHDIATETGADLPAAYQTALAEHVMALAEASNLDPQQRDILTALDAAVRDSGGPAKIEAIIARLPWPASFSSIYASLCDLEQRRIVRRPHGQRSGWQRR